MQNGNRIYDVSASGETMSCCGDLGSWEAPDLQLRALSVTPEQALPGSPLAIEVNVGSVGQPRDRDPRLGMALYDTEAFTVELIREHYDLAQTVAEITRVGLPRALGDRLRTGT